MGYRNFLMVDGDSSLRNTNDNTLLGIINQPSVDNKERQLYFNNNLIVNTDAAFTSTTDTTANGLVEVARASGSGNKLNALNAWVRQSGCLSNNINPVPFTTGTVLVQPLASSVNPDFRPVVGSPALDGAEFICNPVLANLTVSVKEVSNIDKAKVYPNPVFGGKINFGKAYTSFGLFSIKGELVLSGFDQESADVQGIPSGVYILKLNEIIQKVIIP